jgi:hypothetical protein
MYSSILRPSSLPVKYIFLGINLQQQQQKKLKLKNNFTVQIAGLFPEKKKKKNPKHLLNLKC